MKNFTLLPITLSLMMLVSCVGEPGGDLPGSSELNVLFKDYVDKQSEALTVQYHVQRIDSLVNGDVRQSEGKVTMKYTSDSVLAFIVDRADDTCNYYLYENKYYTLYPGIKLAFLKSNSGTLSGSTAGGQLVVDGLLITDTPGTKYSVTNTGQNYFTIQSERKQDAATLIRQITVEKSGLVPKQVRMCYINEKQEFKYTITYLISNYLRDDQMQNNALFDTGFLSNYNLAYSVAISEADVLINKKVPEINFSTFDNYTINLRSLEPQVVLLDFWELWCSPCKKSLPTVDEIARNYKAYGLIVLGVVSEDVGDAATYIKKEGIQFTQAIGNADIKTTFKVSSFPRYVLIGRDGVIRSIYHGYSSGIVLDINRLLSQ